MSLRSSAPVDPSSWGNPVAHTKNNDDSHPEPIPLRDGVRAVTPDPYTDDNPDVRRNFGRS